MSKYPVFQCPRCKTEVGAIGGKVDELPTCPACLNKQVIMVFNRMKPYTFLNLLLSHEDMDCDLIIGGVDMPASFVWNDDCHISAYGIKKFKELMDAEFTVLDNGNIEVHCDNYRLGEQFSLAAAGYIGETEYNRIFGEED